ncbi:MAG: flagellar type III secretion system protein FlhB [Marinobacter sp.]|uniref:flagellar biosynthesis protein FlhB n=1 Tax=Marinobacter sp. TaxID=50741 RepID=UPI0029C1DD9C|nr:flagellar biosynthesis protein FlhB [Marinobacter sp.]MDX5441118.1 flagellar type III secretion system protein FlhB [Alteromonadaceae bacterium]MDX5328026.1 flagellar type III secretion system protein FlhB [Marinobacter sp.]MDX5336748.1 flagellar type III secretion system protein FlhB [Marinobacter sp.]MDX5387906.1 flagellar type III secretion system protein FlhB [Marinobacter sp.]MDX5473202.1 flagellar type III secretion system protein FlhB [Marinobacter sp.]
MAEENDNSQEKTEEPTPRRLEKAKEDGQTARSKELATMAVLLAGAGGLLMFGGGLGNTLEGIMRDSFVIERAAIYDTRHMSVQLILSAKEAAFALSPILIMLLVAAIAGSIGIGGLLFSGKAIAPKLNRIDPIKGLGRMFSLRSLIELVKAIAKVGLVLAVTILILNLRTEDLLAIAEEPIVPAMAHVVWTVGWSFLILSCATIIIAMIDVPFEIYDHQKKLRMTKQEVKDEYKDTEGKPEVKGKIRQLQREMAQRRMMQDVPTADVVITNPTHYAVALKYNQDSMGAPVVVAKGADEIAFKIMEIAREHKVEILRTPPLTRAVYHNTDVGQEIPDGLYMAIAQVLAYVFQLRQFRKGRGAKPGMPDFPIPPEMRRDL